MFALFSRPLAFCWLDTLVTVLKGQDVSKCCVSTSIRFRWYLGTTDADNALILSNAVHENDTTSPVEPKSHRQVSARRLNKFSPSWTKQVQSVFDVPVDHRSLWVHRTDISAFRRCWLSVKRSTAAKTRSIRVASSFRCDVCW